MKNIIRLLLLIFIFITPSICFSTQGKLDSSSGHNSKKEGYHYHYKKDKQVSKTKETKKEITNEQRSKKIGEYFRSANDNVGALDPNLVIHQRNLDEQSRRQILKRDLYKCVICGSNHQLEVDHKRALMNGGTNDPSNLATLCKKCHVEKTSMDKSLKRKRESLKKKG
jgi:hypothetical protein